MKRISAMLLFGVTCGALGIAPVTATGASNSPGQLQATVPTISDAQSDLEGTNVPTYRCQQCGAPHGGCFHPLCPDCHAKLCPPKPTPSIE